MRKRREEEGEHLHVLLNHPIPISSIADEFLKFISRGLILANSHFQKFRVD